MAAAGHALLVACALLCGCATLSRADCPDKDVRCRIANAETKTEVSSSGCEVGGEVDAGFAGDVPAGSVQVSGRCYRSFRDTDGTTFVPMGVMTVGTCYQYHFPDTSIDQSCRPCRSLVDECAGRVAGCRTCPGLCTSSVTAAPGDSCWGLANANGLTLDALLQLNPGLNCEPLAVNQRVCLAMGTGPCTNLCEGRFV